MIMLSGLEKQIISPDYTPLAKFFVGCFVYPMTFPIDGESNSVSDLIENFLSSNDDLLARWHSSSLDRLLNVLEMWHPLEERSIDIKRHLVGTCNFYRGKRAAAYYDFLAILDTSLFQKNIQKILNIEILEFYDPSLATKTLDMYGLNQESLPPKLRRVLSELRSYPPAKKIQYNPVSISRQGVAENTCIFIKTYPKDYAWLSFLVQSIKLRVKGYAELIIVTDDIESNFPREIWNLIEGAGGKVYFSSIPQFCRIPQINNPGYWWQQVCKLHFYRWSDCDFAFCIDSDCFFEGDYDIQTFRFLDGRPIVLRKPWDKSGPGRKWRFAIENLFGNGGSWSHMQRNGLILDAHVLRELDRYTEASVGSTLEHFMLEPLNTMQKSEFEIFGAFADKYFSRDFVFTEKFQAEPLRQFWSWGGLSPEIERLMNASLSR